MKQILIGIKSDPIEYRYSFEWLFKLMKRLDVRYLQIGGFFELPLVDDRFFTELRQEAGQYGVQIRSIFTAHRETSGYFSNNPHLARAARIVYERMINAGALTGARCVGSSMGSVFRDRMATKDECIRLYIAETKSLMQVAKQAGLHSLSMEVMSCIAEPPTLPGEIDQIMEILGKHHAANRTTTVPVYILGDTSHGYCDQNRRVVHSNYELFEHSIPHMCEFHFKNTDAVYGSTYGFSAAEIAKGHVDLARVKELLLKHQDRWPEAEMTGYLEHPGPKLGRDYSDYLLEKMLTESLVSIRKVFG